MPNHPIIPCESVEGWKETVNAYAAALRAAGPNIGLHKLTPEQFEESGLFLSAVEQIRGKRSATMGVKKAFIAAVLDLLKEQKRIVSWKFAGAGDRHDYEVSLKGGRTCCIEAKGCLDGNNTNIFKRPGNADEFVIWSLCQNPGSDPRHNAWSGIHTRLGTEIISRRERVDGLVIWDMLCGTLARPCPKLAADPARAVDIGGKSLPPPCIYLFPRTVPDARNNPHPASWQLGDVHFLNVLAEAFAVPAKEAISVEIHVKMASANVQRQTRFIRDGALLHESGWTTVRRAS